MQSTVQSALIERLFFRLQVRYGSDWNRMWEGIDPDSVKADWEENLSAVFTRNPKAIAYALENMPDRVPTSDQFLKICRQARWPELAAISAPIESEDPQRIQSALDAMNATRSANKSKSLAQECIDNIERLCNGKPSSAQKHMVSHCLRMPNTHTSLDIKAAQ